ncbi:MAG: hybrid sensor histidine kinase/response regulator [Bacteroidetes bacterium]|jgi:two-component system sensor histidine kinase/response regulator|nr:hybrid sensor histidine kinase/response regulator [Bacteroidota bacterium]
MTDPFQHSRPDDQPLLLVVDDTEDNLDLLEFALKKKPIRFLRANSGAECLRIAAHQHPDIIVLDIQMPEMDGFETLRRLRANPATERIPVIFLTAAKKDPRSIEEGLLLGASEYLTKPIDIDELLVRVRSIFKLYKMERELEETRAKFMAMLVHDLRSPLGGIKSVFELLIDLSKEGRTFGPEIIQIVESALSSSTSLLDLVNDLLDLSKYQAGQVQLDRATVDISSVIELSVSGFAVPFQNKNVSLEKEYGAGLPLVSMDPRKVSQVVTNLVSNALKFTPKGGIVKVRSSSIILKKGSVSEPAVAVEVSDNGIGMPQEEIPLLFTHYRQVSSAKKVKEKGTGLGLAICKLIVEAHGGSIEASSVQGKGTTFLFKLPVGQANPQS